MYVQGNNVIITAFLICTNASLADPRQHPILQDQRKARIAGGAACACLIIAAIILLQSNKSAAAATVMCTLCTTGLAAGALSTLYNTTADTSIDLENPINQYYVNEQGRLYSKMRFYKALKLHDVHTPSLSFSMGYTRSTPL